MSLPNLDAVMEIISRHGYSVVAAIKLAARLGDISLRDEKLLLSMHRIRFGDVDDLAGLNQRDHRLSRVRVVLLNPKADIYYIYGEEAATQWVDGIIFRNRQLQLMKLGAIWKGNI